MKNKKRFIIIGILIILILSGLFGFVYYKFKNKNGLNIVERTWINNNKANVVTVNVQNEQNIFSKDGEGFFMIFWMILMMNMI